MNTITATIRTIDRDPARRLITLVLDHNPTRSATLTYRQAAQLGFWLKPGQTIEITGELIDGILHIDTLVLLHDPAPSRRSDLPRHRRLTAFDPIDLKPAHLLILLIIAILVAVIIITTRY